MDKLRRRHVRAKCDQLSRVRKKSSPRSLSGPFKWSEFLNVSEASSRLCWRRFLQMKAHFVQLWSSTILLVHRSKCLRMCKTASTFFAKFSAMSSGGTVQYFLKRSSNFTRGGNYLKMFVKCCSNVWQSVVQMSFLLNKSLQRHYGFHLARHTVEKGRYHG